MRKKLPHIILPILIFLTFLLPVTFSAPTFAANDGSSSLTGRECEYVLGLTSWDCNVDITDQNSLKSGIWTIVVNVVTDITVIATYLTLAYTIYGGYLYMFSYGDPGKVATGKKTLTQAFIGLAITMSATVIMGALRVALVGGTGNISNCVTNECIGPNEMVTNLINWFCGVSGVVAAIFLVYGGISYTTSAGDPGKLKKAKDVILYSIIGLIIIALAVSITAFVSNLINKANEDATEAYINNSKELYEINQIN